MDSRPFHADICWENKTRSQYGSFPCGINHIFVPLDKEYEHNCVLPGARRHLAGNILPPGKQTPGQGRRRRLTCPGRRSRRDARELRFENLAKLRSRLHVVMPAKATSRYYQEVPGFRVKAGMTEKGIFQSVLSLYASGIRLFFPARNFQGSIPSFCILY